MFILLELAGLNPHLSFSVLSVKLVSGDNSPHPTGAHKDSLCHLD